MGASRASRFPRARFSESGAGMMHNIQHARFVTSTSPLVYILPFPPFSLLAECVRMLK